MKLSTILMTMFLIQSTVAEKKDNRKFCKSSRWMQETVDENRDDGDTDCTVQNSRIFGICGLILGDLFKFKSEKAIFVNQDLPEQRYSQYSAREQKAIHQYMKTKINHLLIMHDQLRCGEVREHMEKYYPHLFLIHAYTLSDLSIRGNILPFVDFGLNKIVQDEENLDEDEQDDLDMYVNVPINIRNSITEIFLSFKGIYAQHVRYRRDIDESSRRKPNALDQTTQERTLSKMFEMISRITNARNDLLDTKQEVEDMVKHNGAIQAAFKDEVIRRVNNKMDSVSRKQQYSFEKMIGDLNIPKFGSQATLITIVSIQMLVIIGLIIIITKKSNKYERQTQC